MDVKNIIYLLENTNITVSLNGGSTSVCLDDDSYLFHNTGNFTPVIDKIIDLKIIEAKRKRG